MLHRSGRVVIAGGGAAAIAAMEELRVGGFAGNITVLAGESASPYDRTSCSKGIIDGQQRPADARLPVPAGAHWRLGERAVAVDPVNRVVTSSAEQTYEYDGLIIATGTTADIPDRWPLDETGIYRLQTLSDAWAVRRALRGAGRVAIIGGGLTGCELACGVLQTAREATIIDPHRSLLHRATGDKFGGLVTAEHRSAGIDARLGRVVLDIGRRRGRFLWRGLR